MVSIPAPGSRAPYPYLDFLPAYSPTLVREQTQNLLDLYETAERHLNEKWAQLVDNPNGAAGRARVQELLDSLARSRESVGASVQEWIRTTYPAYYAGGAGDMRVRMSGEPFQWAQPHRDAVGLLAVDTYSSLLAATDYEPDTIKATVRELARETAAETLLASQTASQGGRSLATKLKAQGIANVTYADGKKVSASSYASMVIRARTAVAYNAGGINQGVADGVEVFEISDGPDCGLASHDDDQLANGMIVDPDTAATYPISHPNCVRDFLPRPDLTPEQAQSGDAQSLIDPESADDQAAFDEFLRQEGETNGLTLEQAANKFRRIERTGRVPRSEGKSRPPRVPRNAPSEPVPEVPPAPPVAVPEPVVVPGPVAGTRLPTDALAYATPAARERFAPLTEALNGLHGLPDDGAPEVKVKLGATTTNKGGHFAPYGVKPTLRRKKGEDYATFRARKTEAIRKARVPEIRVNPNWNAENDHSSLSFLHEFGHRTDFTYSTGRDYYHSTAGAALTNDAERQAMGEFLTLVRNSDYFIDARQQTLRGGVAYYNYWTDPAEVWARAYSQWAAGRLGESFPELAVQLDRMRTGRTGYYQWPDEDFVPVAAAVENVLRSRGLMQ